MFLGITICLGVGVIFVIVPAVGVVPPIAEKVIDVVDKIPVTRYVPAAPREPVPAVAVKNEPTARPFVEVMPVIVAVQGEVSDATIDPTVPVADVTAVVGLKTYPVSNKIFLAIFYPPSKISTGLNGYRLVFTAVLGPGMILASNDDPAGTTSEKAMYPSLSTWKPSLGSGLCQT